MRTFVPHARGLYAAGFGLVLLAAAGAAVMALRSDEADEWVHHTFEVREAAAQLLNAVQGAQMNQQGYLLTTNDDYLKSLQAAAPVITQQFAELRRLTADNPAQQARLMRLEGLAAARLDVLQSTAGLAEKGARDQAVDIVRFNRGKELMDEFGALLDEFSRQEYGLLTEREATAVATSRALLALVCASLLGAILLAALLARAAQRGIDTLRERTVELEGEIKLRRDTEDRLRQAQKLEAVGHLTGGIAHDFNNLLTIILGNLDMLLRRIAKFPAQGEVAALIGTFTDPVERAMQGARSAAQLTHRLLAFARRQALDPKALELNQLVSGLSELLRRTLGEGITLETVLAGGLWSTLADANQVESALINICINARDAMPGGGRLTIETGNAYLDENYARQFGDVTPGQYVLLSVTDTGAGIAPEVMERVFEPFFTTKAAGEGSGLGLAMVHGFVKQTGGHIRIYSEIGHGTTVKVYLPRLLPSRQVVSAPSPQVADTSVPRALGQETVLLVEDNAGVREYARAVLEELGYRVLEAADGAGGLRIVEDGARIDLLFTDVVLPDISGRELAGRAVKLRPRMPVLYTTGYTRNAIVHHGRLDPDVHLLGKPYTQQNLARKVRELLDGATAR
jgi:signal transduction histidine kinase